MNKIVNILCIIGSLLILIGFIFVFSNYELFGFAIQRVLFWTGFVLTIPKVFLFTKEKGTKGFFMALAYCIVQLGIGYILFFDIIKIGCTH